jgi:hypothetical protein
MALRCAEMPCTVCGDAVYRYRGPTLVAVEMEGDGFFLAEVESNGSTGHMSWISISRSRVCPTWKVTRSLIS